MKILMLVIVFLVMLKIIKEMFFIVLMELNFYLFKRRCNKLLELAKEGTCYCEELLTWLEVEQKAYRKREDKIDNLYNFVSLTKG